MLSRKTKHLDAASQEPQVVEVHVYPRSDQLNDPISVASLLMPSASATAMTRHFSSKPPNTIADGYGIQCGRLDNIIPVRDNRRDVTPFASHVPNTFSPQQNPVRMSQLMRNFEELLASVQHNLIGAP